METIAARPARRGRADDPRRRRGLPRARGLLGHAPSATAQAALDAAATQAVRPRRARPQPAEGLRRGGLPPHPRHLRRADHHAHREGRRGGARRAASRWAPTTTSSSRSRPRELVARVRALCAARTPSPSRSATGSSFGGLVIDLPAHRVYLDGEELDLTASEYKLLVTLARYPGRVYPRMELVEKVLGYDFEGYERAIDSHVKNLRAKLRRRPARAALHPHGLRQSATGSSRRRSAERSALVRRPGSAGSSASRSRSSPSLTAAHRRRRSLTISWQRPFDAYVQRARPDATRRRSRELAARAYALDGGLEPAAARRARASSARGNGLRVQVLDTRGQRADRQRRIDSGMIRHAGRRARGRAAGGSRVLAADASRSCACRCTSTSSGRHGEVSRRSRRARFLTDRDLAFRDGVRRRARARGAARRRARDRRRASRTRGMFVRPIDRVTRDGRGAARRQARRAHRAWTARTRSACSAGRSTRWPTRSRPSASSSAG